MEAGLAGLDMQSKVGRQLHLSMTGAAPVHAQAIMRARVGLHAQLLAAESPAHCGHQWQTCCTQVASRLHAAFQQCIRTLAVAAV